VGGGVGQNSLSRLPDDARCMIGTLSRRGATAKPSATETGPVLHRAVPGSGSREASDPDTALSLRLLAGSVGDPFAWGGQVLVVEVKA
jgi:hypothetical protein